MSAIRLKKEMTQRNLLPFARTRQVKIDAAIVIGPDRRWNIQHRQRNSLRPRRHEVPQHPVNDRVILNLPLLPVAEHHHRSRVVPSCLFPTRLRIATRVAHKHPGPAGPASAALPDSPRSFARPSAVVVHSPDQMTTPNPTTTNPE